MQSNFDTLVLYAPYRDIDTAIPLYPQERFLEIKECKNERVRHEKYLVWKLLERAIEEHFDLEFANLKFTKNENGKWLCPDLCFSLSHTYGALCVAVSRSPVGIDIERVHSIRESLGARILTEKEQMHLASLKDESRSRFLIEAWVKKESIFKKDGGQTLVPSGIETLDSAAVLRSVIVNGEEYIISVFGGEKIDMRYMEEI